MTSFDFQKFYHFGPNSSNPNDHYDDNEEEEHGEDDEDCIFGDYGVGVGAQPGKNIALL